MARTGCGIQIAGAGPLHAVWATGRCYGTNWKLIYLVVEKIVCSLAEVHESFGITFQDVCSFDMAGEERD